VKRDEESPGFFCDFLRTDSSNGRLLPLLILRRGEIRGIKTLGIEMRRRKAALVYFLEPQGGRLLLKTKYLSLPSCEFTMIRKDW